MQYFGTIETKYEEIFLTQSYMYFNAEDEEITVKELKEKIKTAILKELYSNNEKNAIGLETPYKQTSILMSKVIDWKNLTNQSGIKNQEINYTNLLTSGFTLKEGQVLASPRDMIYESKAYHIDVVTDKAQVKISNVFKDECQYMGVKFGSQYDIKVNDKILYFSDVNSSLASTNN